MRDAGARRALGYYAVANVFFRLKTESHVSPRQTVATFCHRQLSNIETEFGGLIEIELLCSHDKCPIIRAYKENWSAVGAQNGE